jgi:protein-S-isoprenylcysteine O-methyltransferase Ste14
MSAQSACPLHRLTSAEPGARAGGIAALAYGLVAYAAFFACITYAIGFVGNWLVPKSIDSGAAGPLIPSLLINTALLSVFVVQHTIMARPWFKARWTRIIPRAIERSTFVLFASLALALIFWQWRPLPQTLWHVENSALALALSAVSLGGWAIVFLSSFMVSHFDLFGLRQVWSRFQNRPLRPIEFRLVGLYKLVRHPLMVGFIIAVWATPHMTVGHLFFAAMITGYIFMGTWFEERDLIAEHGERYLQYRRQVRGFIPLPRTAPADPAPALGAAR